MRRALCLALAALLLVGTQLEAQASAGRRIPRRWLLAAVGGVTMGLAAVIYNQGRQTSGAGCNTTGCVARVSVAGGLAAGFLVGFELDRLYAMRYRHGPPLTLRGQQLPLGVVPVDVRAIGSTVVAAGEGGVEVVAGGPRLERLALRARGLRGVRRAVPDPATGRLLVGTSVGLYGFRLSGEPAGGDLLTSGEIAALALRGDRVLLATGRRALTATLAGERGGAGGGGGDTLVGLGSGRSFGSAVMDLAWDPHGPVAWVLTEEALVAVAVTDTGLADSLGALGLIGTGRRLRLDGDTAAVAAGDGGVFLVDIRNPREPVQLAQWSAARFAYDVALARGITYLAAGPEGLYLLRPAGDGTMTSLGLARNLGFVAAVDVAGDALFLLDRSESLLRRVPLLKR